MPNLTRVYLCGYDVLRKSHARLCYICTVVWECPWISLLQGLYERRIRSQVVIRRYRRLGKWEWHRATIYIPANDIDNYHIHKTKSRLSHHAERNIQIVGNQCFGQSLKSSEFQGRLRAENWMEKTNLQKLVLDLRGDFFWEVPP